MYNNVCNEKKLKKGNYIYNELSAYIKVFLKSCCSKK